MALFTKITVFAKYSLKLYEIWSIVTLLEICKAVFSRAMYSSAFSHRVFLNVKWREADSWHGFSIGLHSALVLSGEATLEDCDKSDVKPELIFDSVKDIIPYL